MNLSHVVIRNFRSIEDARIDFMPNCRALIGINESGKTNILNALSLLSDEISPELDDMREMRPDENAIESAFVRFLFRLSRLDKIEILKSILPKIYSPDADTQMFDGEKYTLSQFVDQVDESIYEVDLKSQSKSYFYWKMKERKLSERWLCPLQDLPKDVTYSFDGRTSVQLSSLSLIDSTWELGDLSEYCRPATFGDLESLVGRAVIARTKACRPDCFLWSYGDSQLLPPSVSFEEFTSSPEKYEPLRQMFLLAGYEDVVEAISVAEKKRNGMRNLLNRVSNAATEHLKAVWSDYHGLEINVEPNGEDIEVNVRDAYNLYDFSRRSDGFKRFISFLFLVSARTKTGVLRNTLYLHDEPDTGLHPSGARHLLSELIKVSKENYVVFSTHSIFMIDRNKIGRHYIVEKDKEVTTVKVADASNFRDEEVLFNALEFSVFQVLEERNILFEGWKDKRMFEVSISGRSANAKGLASHVKGVGFCHAQGVKDVSKVSSLLEMAKRQWIVVSDGDNPAKEFQRKYTWPGRWYRYDELASGEKIDTSEDFVCEKKVMKSLGSVCKRHAVQFPSEFELPETGKLREIERALSRAGYSAELVKAVLGEFKDELISTLKTSDLRDIYYSVMGKAVGLLRGEEPSSHEGVRADN